MRNYKIYVDFEANCNDEVFSSRIDYIVMMYKLDFTYIKNLSINEIGVPEKDITDLKIIIHEI